ncbi:histone-lysine N-methyltransferase EHMT2, partial [Tachysurus ichikawai]
LFLSRGADIDVVNKEGDTPLSLARPDTAAWVALQINRKLRRGIANRIVRTERIICSGDLYKSAGSGRPLKPLVLVPVIRGLPVYWDQVVWSLNWKPFDVAQGYENVPIPCVNGVDDDDCPSDYKYISENCETSAMNIDRNITHLQ